jgi:hypothetical protein
VTGAYNLCLMDRPMAKENMKIRFIAIAACLLSLSSCRSASTSQKRSDGETVPSTIVTVPLHRTTDSIPANDVASPSTGAVATTGANGSSASVEASRSWVQEKIGPSDAASFGLSSLALAPDGRAVAFSIHDESCCSNSVTGWSRDTRGAWTPIAKTQETFVQSAGGAGAMGGPDSIAFFKDRFIAIGRRGSILDVENSSKVTTWTSVDGLNWTAIEDPDNPDNTVVGLVASLDGNMLLGAWSTGSNVHIRSTVDGQAWSEVGNLDTSTIGTYAYARSISTQSINGQQRYVVIGTVESLDRKTDKLASTAFVSTSTDGTAWKSFVLENVTAQPSAIATGIATINGELVIYGEGYGDSTETTVATAWRSRDGVTFTAGKVGGCQGRLVDPTLDVSVSFPRIVAVCSVQDGPIEGDNGSFITELMMSTDGATFVPMNDAPPEWVPASSDVLLGPIVVENGSIVVGVGDTRFANTGSLSIWRR